MSESKKYKWIENVTRQEFNKLSEEIEEGIFDLKDISKWIPEENKLIEGCKITLSAINTYAIKPIHLLLGNILAARKEDSSCDLDWYVESMNGDICTGIRLITRCKEGDLKKLEADEKINLKRSEHFEQQLKQMEKILGKIRKQFRITEKLH